MKVSLEDVAESAREDGRVGGVRLGVGQVRKESQFEIGPIVGRAATSASLIVHCAPSAQSDCGNSNAVCRCKEGLLYLD